MHSVYADGAAEQSSNFQLSKAIQNIPPELCEMILKEYIAIKIKEKKEMGWDKVHKHIPKPGWDKVNGHISKLPFCQYEQRIVPMVNCFEYADCFFKGFCFPVSKGMEIFIKHR